MYSDFSDISLTFIIPQLYAYYLKLFAINTNQGRPPPPRLMLRMLTFIIHVITIQVHVLSDATRGATMEAVISRMKTIQASMSRCPPGSSPPRLRFVAVSATIPNIQDVGLFLFILLYLLPSYTYKVTTKLSNYVYFFK